MEESVEAGKNLTNDTFCWTFVWPAYGGGGDRPYRPSPGFATDEKIVQWMRRAQKNLDLKIPI